MFQLGSKDHIESASMMSSGKLFQSWAVTTGKAWLPIVDSLTGDVDVNIPTKVQPSFRAVLNLVQQVFVIPQTNLKL